MISDQEIKRPQEQKLGHLSDVLKLGHRLDWIIASYLGITQLVALCALVALWFIPEELGQKTVVIYLIAHIAFAVFSITAYAHRLVSHKASERISPLLHLVFGYVGQTSAVQGSLASWAGQHRAHHAVDAHQRHDEDPYSAVWFTSGWLNFWWSHMLCYFFCNPHGQTTYASRINVVLRQYPIMTLQHRFYPIFLILIVYLLPFSLGLTISGSWQGGGFLMLMSILATVIVQHITWSVNSFTHLWGQDAARSSAKNNFFWLLPMGEGNHHADHHDAPTDFRNGFGTLGWLLDPTRYVLLFLRAFKLVGPLRRTSLAVELRVITERKIASLKSRFERRRSELWSDYEERLTALKADLCERAKHFDAIKREKKALLARQSEHTREQLIALKAELQYKLELARAELRHSYRQFKLEVQAATRVTSFAL